MELQYNPNGWSCLPTAFAMVLDITVDAMLELLGHDGSSKPYISKNFRAGFHEQECIRVADDMGFSCTPFEIFPRISPFQDGSEARTIVFGDSEDANMIDFVARVQLRKGVFCGCTGDGIGHAVAWDGRKVFDPVGKIYSLWDMDKHFFCPRTFWLMEGR